MPDRHFFFFATLAKTTTLVVSTKKRKRRLPVGITIHLLIMNVPQILLTIALIFFGCAVMGSLVVLLWAIGCVEKIKTRFNLDVNSQPPDASNEIGEKSTSSVETAEDLETGAPAKGSYDMTPVDSQELEPPSPRSKMSDTIDFADESTKVTSYEAKDRNHVAGAPFPFLCVTKRTYPQVKPAATRGAFVALEEDT